MKRNPPETKSSQSIKIPIIIMVILIIIGLLNIFLWQQKVMSIHGLVLGLMSFILAWFVFHFRRKK